MEPTSHLVVAAKPGWSAYYDSETEDDAERARVVAWSLAGGESGRPELVGLVVAPDDPTRTVPAPAGASSAAPTFNRYGYGDD